jgi:hypothetical protein
VYFYAGDHGNPHFMKNTAENSNVTRTVMIVIAIQSIPLDTHTFAISPVVIVISAHGERQL